MNLAGAGTRRDLIHGKKGGVYLVENARWIYAKRGICLHLLVFLRSENPRFSNCFAVGEFEYSFDYPVFSHYGERWKTHVFWNLPVC